MSGYTEYYEKYSYGWGNETIEVAHTPEQIERREFLRLGGRFANWPRTPSTFSLAEFVDRVMPL